MDSEFLDIVFSRPPSRRAWQSQGLDAVDARRTHLTDVISKTSGHVQVCEQAATFPRSNTRTATKRSTPSAVCSECLIVSKTVLPLSQHTDPSPKRTRALHSQNTSRASFPNFATRASQALSSSLDHVCRKKRDQETRHMRIGDQCHDLHKRSCRPCRADPLCASPP